MERALVVGGTGFVGRHIVAALVHSQVEVVAMRRWNSDPAAVAALGVPTLAADLLDRKRLVEVLPGFNYVFMAAAPAVDASPQDFARQSALGMRNLLSVCRQVDVERVIVTSCASTLARSATGSLSSAEDVYLPGSPAWGARFAATIRDAQHRVDAQYLAELECMRLAADGQDLVILCPGICIGPGARLPARSLLGKLPDAAHLNVVDVADVARAHVAAAQSRSRELFLGQRLALGGDNTTIGELYRRLEPAGSGERHLGRYDVQVTDDLSRVRALALFGANLWLDSSRAAHELKFKPRPM